MNHPLKREMKWQQGAVLFKLPCRWWEEDFLEKITVEQDVDENYVYGKSDHENSTMYYSKCDLFFKKQNALDVIKALRKIRDCISADEAEYVVKLTISMMKK